MPSRRNKTAPTGGEPRGNVCAAASGALRALRLTLLFACMAPWLAAWPLGAHAESGPSWQALTPAQRQALAPLHRDWSTLDIKRKQKWLRVAARFPSMPPEERVRVQQRMSAWAEMSPAERAQARLQFQATRQWSPEDRRERWKAYRALSPEERHRLAQSRAAHASGHQRSAAPRPADVPTTKRNLVIPAPSMPSRAVTPTVVQAKPGASTTTMDAPSSAPTHHQPGLPKIVATPGFVDPATLLPRRGPQGAAAHSVSKPKRDAGKKRR